MAVLFIFLSGPMNVKNSIGPLTLLCSSPTFRFVLRLLHIICVYSEYVLCSYQILK